MLSSVSDIWIKYCGNTERRMSWMPSSCLEWLEYSSYLSPGIGGREILFRTIGSKLNLEITMVVFSAVDSNNDVSWYIMTKMTDCLSTYLSIYTHTHWETFKRQRSLFLKLPKDNMSQGIFPQMQNRRQKFGNKPFMWEVTPGSSSGTCRN